MGLEMYGAAGGRAIQVAQRPPGVGAQINSQNRCVHRPLLHVMWMRDGCDVPYP